MARSRVAKRQIDAHRNRLKALPPKTRFKSLSKKDQYIVLARSLAAVLDDRRRRMKGSGANLHAWAFNVSNLKPALLQEEPSTGLITQDSKQRIKRAVSDLLRKEIGQDAYFIFAIEQFDGAGTPKPHLHGVVLCYVLQRPRLKRVLQRLTDASSESAVRLDRLTRLGKKLPNELATNEADYLAYVAYTMKDENTWTFRSRTLIKPAQEHFEYLKKHYRR